jgi:sugar phosphate isomerase/epimerase
MSVLSFSTMWAQQERFEDIASFRRLVASFGYTAIEVSHSTSEAGLATLMGDGELPLTSLHAPTPMRSLADGRHNGDANLASPDEAERRLAIAETKRTIDFAARAGLRAIVIHLGAVGETRDLVRDVSGLVVEPEFRLRRLVEAGEGDSEVAASTRDELARWRAGAIDAHIEAARRSLRELVEYAAPHGVALGLESRVHYHEIPHPAEALYLLAGYDNAVAGYWHDVGHCEVQARLGLIERASWFPSLSDRTIGSHLHDVDGLADHRAPGAGDVDWAYIAAGLPSTALRVFEIDQRQPDDKVAAGIEYLRQRGVVE